jgi:hypothetical protein
MQTSLASNHVSTTLILVGATAVARLNAACAVEPLAGTNYFFLVAVLNDKPYRIETLRMRSGVRFMIRAASSNDLEDFAWPEGLARHNEEMRRYCMFFPERGNFAGRLSLE